MSQSSRTSSWIGRLTNRQQSQPQSPGQPAPAGNTEIQVAGTFLMDLLFGLGPYRSLVLRSMVKRDIARVNPESWYPMQNLSRTLEEVQTSIGPHILFWVGRKTAQQLLLRAEAVFESPHDAIAVLDRCYRLSHRIQPAESPNALPVGNWQFNRRGAGAAEVLIQSPYPHEWLHGLICGAVRDGDPMVQVQTTSTQAGQSAFVLRWD